MPLVRGFVLSVAVAGIVQLFFIAAIAVGVSITGVGPESGSGGFQIPKWLWMALPVIIYALVGIPLATVRRDRPDIVGRRCGVVVGLAALAMLNSLCWG